MDFATSNGAVENVWRWSFQTFPSRFHPAPGNQRGMYFTERGGIGTVNSTDGIMVLTNRELIDPKSTWVPTKIYVFCRHFCHGNECIRVFYAISDTKGNASDRTRSRVMMNMLQICLYHTYCLVRYKNSSGCSMRFSNIFLKTMSSIGWYGSTAFKWKKWWNILRCWRQSSPYDWNEKTSIHPILYWYNQNVISLKSRTHISLIIVRGAWGRSEYIADRWSRSSLASWRLFKKM